MLPCGLNSFWIVGNLTLICLENDAVERMRRMNLMDRFLTKESSDAAVKSTSLSRRKAAQADEREAAADGIQDALKQAHHVSVDKKTYQNHVFYNLDWCVFVPDRIPRFENYGEFQFD
jgi:hypothetical protein